MSIRKKKHKTRSVQYLKKWLTEVGSLKRKKIPDKEVKKRAGYYHWGKEMNIPAANGPNSQTGKRHQPKLRKRRIKRDQQKQQRRCSSRGMTFLLEVSPKCIINITESIEKVKRYEHLFKLDGFFVDALENKEGWENNCVYLFGRQAFLKYLSYYYRQSQGVIMGKVYILWDVTLPKPSKY